MKAKKRFAVQAAASAAIAILGLALSCGNPLAPAKGAFSVAEADDISDPDDGNVIVSVECSPVVEGQGGERATPIGGSSRGVLTIRNSGKGDLVIRGAEILLLDDEGGVSTGGQEIFSFADGKPDFPLTVAKGSSLEIAFGFKPISFGVKKASVLFATSAGDRLVRLIGYGAFHLTLAVPSEETGRIIRPFVVESGETITRLWVQPTVELAAETTDPLGFTEINYWWVQSSAISADFDGEGTSDSLETVATLHDDAEIMVDFTDVFVYVSSGGAGSGNVRNDPIGTLADAISVFNADTAKKGIAISYDGGAQHAASGFAPNRPCILRGGYIGTAHNFETRPDSYRTSSFLDPAGSTASRIYVGSADFALSGAGINPGTLIEGITIEAGQYDPPEGQPDRVSVGLAVTDGAAPTLKHCTFIGGNDPLNSAGAYVFRASPIFEDCVLSGGTVSGSGGRSAGLQCDMESSPVFLRCVLRGGNSSGDRGKSFGVLNNNYAASPVISDSELFAGTGAGASYAFWSSYGGRPELRGNQIHTANDGGENWGIFLGSNGRMYVMSGNNFYACGSGLVYFDYGGQTYTDIADVNEQWVEGWDESYGFEDNTNVEP